MATIKITGKKISELGERVSITGDELIPCEVNGENKSIKAKKIMASGLPDGVHLGTNVYIGANVEIEGGFYTGPRSGVTLANMSGHPQALCGTVLIGTGEDLDNSSWDDITVVGAGAIVGGLIGGMSWDQLASRSVGIHKGVVIGTGHSGNIEETQRSKIRTLIADGVYIGNNSVIRSNNNEVVIHAGVDIRGGALIGSGVVIGTDSSIGDYNTDYGYISNRAVTICRNVIIGTGRYITPLELESLEMTGQRTIIAENVHIGMDETPLDNINGVHIRGCVSIGSTVRIGDNVSIGSAVRIADNVKFMNMETTSMDELFAPGTFIGTNVIIGTGRGEQIVDGHFGGKNVILGDLLFIEGGLTIYADAQGLHVKSITYNRNATIPWG